jgi:hypothetical protein
MPNGEFEEHLLRMANRFAGGLGTRLSDDGLRYLRNVLEPALPRGAEEARLEEGRLQDEVFLRVTENALLRLVFEAALVHQERPTREYRRLPPEAAYAIRDDDLSRALAGLCPGFWPFC